MCCAADFEGQYLRPKTIMRRLCGLGLELFGARNTALDVRRSVSPAPLVADAPGFSCRVAFLYADAAGDPWSSCVDRRAEH
ncbi:hypothetical protein D7003_13770 [Arthrobacter oryzae]|uniref:Uncharacterized protein n=1 Tax=Arthrobacter oryzae TaxID=409290 RepID=A0A3N0BUA6_9MICC|nr:hypothetical protein D7003_13770 [Arthrobacter oryzae]